MDKQKNGIGVKEIRRTVLLMAVVLLVVIMTFTGFVNYMTFADNYNKSLANTYSVAGNEIVRKIEYSLLYGKPINNFYGMNDTLKELKIVVDAVEQVKVVTPEGDILYDLNGFVRDARLPDKLLDTNGLKQSTSMENPNYAFYQGKVYIFIPINENKINQVASLVMIFDDKHFLQMNSTFAKSLFIYLIFIAIFALIVLSIILFRTRFVFKNNEIDKKKLLIVFIVVLGAAQLVYSGINYVLFRSAYNDMSDSSRSFIENIVGENIAGIYAKGLHLESIEGVDDYLNSINVALPQIKDIYLDYQPGTELRKNEKPIIITATISQDYIDDQMFAILLNMLTVLVISIFFMIELTLLAVTLMIRGPTVKEKLADSKANIGSSHGLIRALIFFINLCAFMPMTFIPIVMKKLYSPVAGLSKDVVLGLPLSAEMLGGVIAILIAGKTINRQGWRSLFFTGAVFLVIGNLLSGMSPAAIPFILSRMVAGLGLGYILMTIRSLVVSLPESNAGIAEFAAGSIAGLNCGAVIGGMLADRIGYEVVFFLAACGIIIPIIFVRNLMTDYEIAVKGNELVSSREKIIAFLTDKKALLFLLCIFIPYFICGAFLDYFFPLFASENGLSQSDISRGILLNGLFIIYLGPLMTRIVINKLGNTKGIIASMLIVIFALTVFAFSGSVVAAFVTISLLGVAESFGISLKTTYFLNLKGIKDMEINKGIASFSIMVSSSRMAGPIVYGMALSLGTRMGVGLISLIVLLLIVVFVMFTWQKPGTDKMISNSQNGINDYII
ncbi:MAG: MFS transporter [Syntrophomonadaceae bacterium]|nr:MFS transporter [Syntrophomonadaceae bacterium]